MRLPVYLFFLFQFIVTGDPTFAIYEDALPVHPGYTDDNAATGGDATNPKDATDSTQLRTEPSESNPATPRPESGNEPQYAVVKKTPTASSTLGVSPTPQEPTFRE